MELDGNVDILKKEERGREGGGRGEVVVFRKGVEVSWGDLGVRIRGEIG